MSDRGPRTGVPKTTLWVTVAFVVLLGVLVALLALFVVARSIRGSAGRSPQACAVVEDHPPLHLEWTAEEGSWHRSEPFEVRADQLRTRVDTAVHGERQAPVFPDPVSIRAVTAGTPLSELRASDPKDAAAPDPENIVPVGSGIDGVNEEVELAEGRWELVSNGRASQTTVRPCGPSAD